MNYSKSVARGAAWLDKQSPDWYTKINVDRLDLDSNRNCVCGQVFGSYGYDTPVIKDHFAIVDGADGHHFRKFVAAFRLTRFARRNGFYGESPGKRFRLEVEWSDLVLARQADREVAHLFN